MYPQKGQSTGGLVSLNVSQQMMQSPAPCALEPAVFSNAVVVVAVDVGLRTARARILRMEGDGANAETIEDVADMCCIVIDGK